MRRIRSQPGGAVLFEPAASPTLRVPYQIAADTDARGLIDAIRVDLAIALRARSTNDLRPTWRLLPIGGTATRARAEIETESGNKYLDRVFSLRVAETIPALTRKWLAKAIPQAGPVATPEPNTSGGPVPTTTR